MGIAQNFFESRFGKLNINEKGNGYQIKVDYSLLGKKIDRAQDVLDDAIWNDMQKYMPKDTGELIARTNALNQNTRGEIYLYDPKLAYGHFQYEGIVYKDPVYGVGGFTDGNGRWWSRRGVKKVPSDQPLFYTNPLAEAHWNEVAEQNHKREWVNTVRKALK